MCFASQTSLVLRNLLSTFVGQPTMVNLSMDFTHLHSNNVVIDYEDAKAKVQADVSPEQKFGKIWHKCTLSDHDWSTCIHKTVTPMMHLFMETEIDLEDTTNEENKYTVKRSGSAAILVNLSYFKPKTVQRAFINFY